jgi:hypothetical protein
LCIAKVYNLSFNSTVLVADNDDAITKGFKDVFTIEKRVNCWAHVHRNLTSQLKVFDEKLKKDIMFDIYSIQELFIDDLFEKACNLFEKKWEKHDSNIDKILSFFRENYVNSNNRWYEGYCNGLPSTTNALESTHAKIKEFIKTRLGMIEFLNECRMRIMLDFGHKFVPNVSL